MRQAGSYILSATIHAAGLALLAFAPGYSRPESAVTSGGIQVGALFEADAVAASNLETASVEFELTELLTAETQQSSIDDSAASSEPEFAPERTHLPLDQNEPVTVAPDTLPVFEVRSEIRQSPRIARPVPQRIDNAELVAAALAEQVTSPISPPLVIEASESKPLKPKQPSKPVEELSSSNALPKTQKPKPQAKPAVANAAAVSPPESKQPADKSIENPVSKPVEKPKPQAVEQPAEEKSDQKKSEVSEQSRVGGNSQKAGIDEYPRILPVNTQPEYPAEALELGHQGRVLLSVLVSERGTVAQVRVSKSCGFKSLDESAAAAVRTWKFQPAERAGKPAACWVKVPINFRIDASGN